MKKVYSNEQEARRGVPHSSHYSHEFHRDKKVHATTEQADRKLQKVSTTHQASAHRAGKYGEDDDLEKTATTIAPNHIQKTKNTLEEVPEQTIQESVASVAGEIKDDAPDFWNVGQLNKQTAAFSKDGKMNSSYLPAHFPEDPESLFMDPQLNLVDCTDSDIDNEKHVFDSGTTQLATDTNAGLQPGAIAVRGPDFQLAVSAMTIVVDGGGDNRLSDNRPSQRNRSMGSEQNLIVAAEIAPDIVSAEIVQDERLANDRIHELEERLREATELQHEQEAEEEAKNYCFHTSTRRVRQTYLAVACLVIIIVVCFPVVITQRNNNNMTTTDEPTTEEPSTVLPTTVIATSAPTAIHEHTLAPTDATTPEPTTPEPTTPEPTTPEPTTPEPTTPEPTALNLCPLCPEGQMSSVPDTVLQAGVTTCGSLEKEVLPFLNQTQCDDQAANIALASNVCACLDISFDIPTCPDGTPLKQPDLTIDLLYWETPALLEAVDSLTCKDLGPDIRELTSEQTEYDNYLVYCGCIVDVGTGDIDLAQGICENGDPLDPAFLDVPINDFGTTCESLALDISYFIVDGESDGYQTLFSEFIYYGHKLCGCEKVEEDDYYCDLCEDGSVIQPVTEDDYLNCAYFAGIAYAISATDQFCPYYQGWGEYCGCNNPVVNEEVCRLCGDDTLLPDVWSDSETTFFGSEDQPFPCFYYEVTDSLFEVDNDGLQLTCDERRELVGGECCGL